MPPLKRKTQAITLALITFVALVFFIISFSPETKMIQNKSWGYQLQNVKLMEIGEVRVDYLVVDHTDDRGKPWSREIIEHLKTNPDGSRRILLSYLSIGEAEDYRSYWDADWTTNPPTWLGLENARWKGNYAVDFANSDWQSLIYGRPTALLDIVISQGFDGVYLDRVDAFYGQGVDAPSQMKAFVADIRKYARERKPGFLIIQQNAEELLTDPNHRSNIDGLAKEDLLYNVTGAGKANPPAMVQSSTEFIDLLAAENKPILVVEYDVPVDFVATLDAEIRKRGYTPAFATRDLDTTPSSRHGRD